MHKDGSKKLFAIPASEKTGYITGHSGETRGAFLFDYMLLFCCIFCVTIITDL